MLNKTYLILAHKNPDQLNRLVSRLNDNWSVFYIHIDKKSDIRPFTDLINGDNIVFLSKRTNCLWGDFSQLNATLDLMNEAIKNRRGGMIIHLTGQDYPIKSKKEIDDFLEKHKDENFIDTIPVEEVWRDNYKDKVESYKFNLSSEKGSAVTFRKISKSSIKAFLQGQITFKQLMLLRHKRKLKLDLKHYGGSAWWAFNGETLRKIYEYVMNHYALLNDYYQYTTCPDEFFFQTIIKHLQEKDSSIIIAPSFTYVNWTRNPQAASPLTFSIDDIEELKLLPADKLFARKFDTALDEKILDALDKWNGFAK